MEGDKPTPLQISVIIAVSLFLIALGITGFFALLRWLNPTTRKAKQALRSASIARDRLQTVLKESGRQTIPPPVASTEAEEI